jgi:hypothetical protein
MAHGGIGVTHGLKEDEFMSPVGRPSFDPARQFFCIHSPCAFPYSALSSYSHSPWGRL